METLSSPPSPEWMEFVAVLGEQDIDVDCVRTSKELDDIIDELWPKAKATAKGKVRTHWKKLSKTPAVWVREVSSPSPMSASTSSSAASPQVPSVSTPKTRTLLAVTAISEPQNTASAEQCPATDGAFAPSLEAAEEEEQQPPQTLLPPTRSPPKPQEEEEKEEDELEENVEGQRTEEDAMGEDEVPGTSFRGQRSPCLRVESAEIVCVEEPPVRRVKVASPPPESPLFEAVVVPTPRKATHEEAQTPPMSNSSQQCAAVDPVDAPELDAACSGLGCHAAADDVVAEAEDAPVFGSTPFPPEASPPQQPQPSSEKHAAAPSEEGATSTEEIPPILAPVPLAVPEAVPLRDEERLTVAALDAMDYGDIVEAHRLTMAALGVNGCFGPALILSRGLRKWRPRVFNSSDLSEDESLRIAKALPIEHIASAEEFLFVRSRTSHESPSLAWLTGYWFYMIDNNKAEALRCYRTAVDGGSAAGQYNLAMIYQNGEGVLKDDAEAVRLYRLSSARGHASSQCNLGMSLSLGYGAPKDPIEAAKFYMMAADNGHAAAQCNLGWAYLYGVGVGKSASQAVKFYRLSAEQGTPSAEYTLAMCLLNGDGTQKDVPEAMKLLRRAAEHGHLTAIYALGKAHYKGEGVAKDTRRAIDLWRKAADNGNADAAYRLGRCLRKGHGIKKDKAEAEKYLNAAKQLGHPGAQKELDSLHRHKPKH